MEKEMIPRGLGEMCRKNDREPIYVALDEAVIVPNNPKAQSGHGGVGLVMSSVQRYRTIDKLSTQSTQLVTVKLDADDYINVLQPKE